MSPILKTKLLFARDDIGFSDVFSYTKSVFAMYQGFWWLKSLSAPLQGLQLAEQRKQSFFQMPANQIYAQVKLFEGLLFNMCLKAI